MTISMAEEKRPQSDESPGETAEGAVSIQTAGKVTSSGNARVRLIQQSPTANPKLVEAARKFGHLREFCEEQHLNPDSINYYDYISSLQGWLEGKGLREKETS
jgi:hypothetical protein